MFNLGFTEIFALAAIALLVIGPKQLPEMARNLARLLNEFKRVTNSVMEPMDTFKSEVNRTTQSITDFKDEIFEDRLEEHASIEDNSEFLSHETSAQPAELKTPEEIVEKPKNDDGAES